MAHSGGGVYINTFLHSSFPHSILDPLKFSLRACRDNYQANVTTVTNKQPRKYSVLGYATPLLNGKIEKFQVMPNHCQACQTISQTNTNKVNKLFAASLSV